MIEITLTDSTTSATLQAVEVPLQQETVNNDVEVTTLDNDMTIFIQPDSDRRIWSHTWGFLSQADFNILNGFRDRQRTLFQYPLLTITELGIDSLPVYLKVSAKNIVDNCGTVAGVTITMRESRQMPDSGS